MLKVAYFQVLYNPHKLTICMQLPPSVPIYMQITLAVINGSVFVRVYNWERTTYRFWNCNYEVLAHTI